MEKISYFAHEGKMARAERTQRRLWIASLVLTVALVATNTAWVFSKHLCFLIYTTLCKVMSQRKLYMEG